MMTKIFWTALYWLFSLGAYHPENSAECYGEQGKSREVYCAPFFGKGSINLQLGSRHPLHEWRDFIYPQFAEKYEARDKVISRFAWQWVQEKARQALKETESQNCDGAMESYAHENVVRHWKSIIRGEVPFGYRIKKRP